MFWALKKYIRGPSTLFTGVHVLSDRASQLPNPPNSGIRQVVVRITSQQSMKTVNATSKNNPQSQPEAKEQNCTEYIVMQKLMLFGEEDGWRIWGHTRPTSPEELRSPLFAPGYSLAQRLDAMRDYMTGRR